MNCFEGKRPGPCFIKGFKINRKFDFSKAIACQIKLKVDRNFI